MDNKIYSFLGLATKAGKLISGDDTCEKAVKAGKVKLVIISEDASANTKKSKNDLCSFYNTDIRFFGEKELLGKYTGKHLRSVLAITDAGFAKKLIELIDTSLKISGGE